MISHSATRLKPAWSIACAMWMGHRRGFAAVLSATILCGLVFRIVGQNVRDAETRDSLGFIPMGLLLFMTFILCGFTETDRRARFTGFPSRMFTLPVPTLTLTVTPVLFGIAAVGLVYAVWARLVLPALGNVLPLAWPALYLATGMISYQAIVWSLARFRVARILALGIGGTFFAIGWVAFRGDFERELVSWLIPEGMSVRPVLCALLSAFNLGALAIAYMSVESQRRGGTAEWQGWRRTIDFIADALPARHGRFDSPDRSQFWFEWRRHGLLLPASTACVLLVIMAPAPFLEPLGADTTTSTLLWILLLPLLLAFALGQGFGKADLWSKEPGPSLFLATRPLSADGLVGAKIKAAGLGALISWVLVGIFAPWWVCLWGDWRSLGDLWRMAQALYPTAVLYALPWLLFVSLVILTWRLLVGGLFIGLSGKNWMLATATCGVFALILGTPFVMMGLRQHPMAYRRLLRLPSWLPWVIAGFFVLKVAIAFGLTAYATRQGWVSSRSIGRYLVLWLAATAFLAFAAWLVIPVQGWPRWLSTLLALFSFPLVRMAYAPIALGRSRQH